MNKQEYTNIICKAKENKLNIKIRKINSDIKRGIGYGFIINNLECYC